MPLKQRNIKSKLRDYLTRSGRDKDFIKKFEKGYCSGISSLWLYAMRLQMQKKEPQTLFYLSNEFDESMTPNTIKEPAEGLFSRLSGFLWTPKDRGGWPHNAEKFLAKQPKALEKEWYRLNELLWLPEEECNKELAKLDTFKNLIQTRKQLKDFILIAQSKRKPEEVTIKDSAWLSSVEK